MFQQNKFFSKKCILLLLTLIFFLPWIFAYYFFYLSPHSLSKKTLNHGILLTPTLNGTSLSESFPSEKKWHLALIATPNCRRLNCEHNLLAMQQAHLLLGKDFDRVIDLAILLKLDNVQSEELFKGLAQVFPAPLRLSLAKETFQKWDKPSGLTKALSEGGILLFDPFARAVLFFPGAINVRDVYGDMHHLLKWSTQ